MMQPVSEFHSKLGDRTDDSVLRPSYMVHIARDLGALRLGSTGEIVETMAILGCRSRTRAFFSRTKGEAKHIFLLCDELDLVIKVGDDDIASILLMIPAHMGEDRELNFMGAYFDKTKANIVRSMSRIFAESPGRFRRVDVQFTNPFEAGYMWLTLVLRMLCWLALRNFHPSDVQLSRIDLMGTRLPVCIN
ncbi:hypothetical protein B0T24DRAFT_705674 [Lasiosphaeria ovina]|uniref:Uncharacterized protein n=1 Tax=Lasiosphaeria ovina TaxID=92902 RepID=A0AAE0N4Z3_9PEZI|nr:hypothetical protein B0T24DRAFT_705674 [Lasiosphaeria ovina]